MSRSGQCCALVAQVLEELRHRRFGPRDRRGRKEELIYMGTGRELPSLCVEARKGQRAAGQDGVDGGEQRGVAAELEVGIGIAAAIPDLCQRGGDGGQLGTQGIDDFGAVPMLVA